jgi:site-specific DNA recombinase
MARDYTRRKGYRIVAEIAEDDKGASGAAFELEGLNRVLEMAQDGEFDVLIPREIDRLSRNLAKQLIVEEELKRAGAEIEYCLAEYPDTPEGRLNKHIRATIAEYEREKIAERTARARRLKVKAGNVMVYGNPPYGYREAEVDGKKVLVIEEGEAQVIRNIYSWYVEGDTDGLPLSIRAIAQQLEGTPTYADIHHTRRKRRPVGRWSSSVVGRILENETYSGTWYHGKMRRSGEHWVRNPDDHLIAVEVPAIVEREIWDAAQERRAYNKEHAKRNRRHKYLLARRVRCGGCGLKMTGATNIPSRCSEYRCPATLNNHDYARDCDAPHFSVRQVDAAVWDWLVSFLTDSEALKRGLWEIHHEKEQANEPMRARLRVVDDLIADNRTQLEKLLDLYLSGEFPKEVILDRRTRLEKTVSALERERADLATNLEKHLLTTEQIQTMQEFAAKVGEKLEVMGDDFDAKRGLIEALEVQATLTLEDGEKVVYARCILGEQRSPIASHTSSASV